MRKAKTTSKATSKPVNPLEKFTATANPFLFVIDALGMNDRTPGLLSQYQLEILRLMTMAWDGERYKENPVDEVIERLRREGTPATRHLARWLVTCRQ